MAPELESVMNFRVVLPDLEKQRIADDQLDQNFVSGMINARVAARHYRRENRSGACSPNRQGALNAVEWINVL
jgi:hypothetical protein